MDFERNKIRPLASKEVKANMSNCLESESELWGPQTLQKNFSNNLKHLTKKIHDPNYMGKCDICHKYHQCWDILQKASPWSSEPYAIF